VARRRYRLGRRAELAAATRRRIIEATLELHDEQGISGTSVRDVAGKAGVAPATVLHHFPRMDDLIRACGELSETLAPIPSEAELGLATGRGERIRLLTLVLFSWYEQMGPGWDHLQVDRRRIPQVDAWLRQLAERHRSLVAAALGPANPVEISLATALTTHGVWLSLRDAGMETPEAAAHVARQIAAVRSGPIQPAGITKGVH
jgi:AcrR family transcriptional regulator